LFAVILAVALTVLQCYVFWRAASVPVVRRHVSPRVLIGVGVAFWASYFFGAALDRQDTGILATSLELWSMTWLAVLFLMSVPLLAAEAATGFGLLLPTIAPRLRGAALAVGGGLTLLALVQGLRAPVVQSYEVYSRGLPVALDGTVIVAISDLHLGSLLGATWLAARVEQVHAEKPDLVVLIGDVFEGHNVPAAELLTVLKSLSAPLGKWGVIGNHEMHSGGEANGVLFESVGVHLLRNGWIELRPGLILAGLDSLSLGPAAGVDGPALEATLAGRPQGATVLIAHAPPPQALVASSGVDLLLAGHTHGGQLWPFGYLVRQWFPLFEGRYQVGATTVIVSRGTGTWGPRMRLWRPAEIIRVTLRAGVDANATAVHTRTFR
jgi:predicted MPP superfamily phosphohydrolase